MTTPMKRPARTAGTIVAAATVPAAKALPVASNTTRGSTILAIEFLSADRV